MTASRKLANDKVFFFFHKAFFIKIIVLQSKNIIALNFYIDINELVYERRLMMKVFYMAKFLCSKAIFCKNRCIFFKNVRIGNIFVENPCPKYFNADI